MKVERIRVQAFGRLHDFDTGREPLGNLVVVVGPNEAGKTTLFQFLATALYGFSPAARENHPYAPWSGAEPAGIALLRLGDDTAVEVHRRLPGTPSGTVVRAGRTEDLRNKPLPAAEHVPAAVFRQVYAISLAELAGLQGDSWTRIQDRLISALGAADLRPARVVAEELEKEAAGLWRPDRRGHQELRLLRDRLRELETHRRDVVDADRVLRERVRELDRVHAELAAARAEREDVEIYVERFRGLQPVRAALQRIAALQREAGDGSDLAGMPRDPASRLAELDGKVREQSARLADLVREGESPKKRSEVLQAADHKLLQQRAEVEKVTTRVTAAGWMRARACQVEHELRELGRRLEHEAGELFETSIAKLDTDRVRALPAAQLRTRARDLEDARARTEAQREAARQLAAAEASAANEGAIAHWGVAGVVLLVGAGLLGAGVLLARRPFELAGAVLLGAGMILLGTALLRGRTRTPRAPAPELADAEVRESEALKKFSELLSGLPVRAALLEGSPSQIVVGVERMQLMLRDSEERERESAKLRTDSALLAVEVNTLARACETTVPADPVAAAHLLAAAAVEATRRQATVERATEELARLQRTREREEDTLARMRADADALHEKVRRFGGGDEQRGLDLLRARREAATQAARMLGDLEREHPDLDAIRARIEEAEEKGEEWVADEEALARRRVHLPELTRRVEALGRTDAALEQEIRHRAEGETLDRVDGEIAVLEEQLRRLERERDRRHVLARVLREADRRYREENQPELIKRAGEHLARITGGRYSRVLLADGTGEITFRVRSDDAPRPVAVEEPLSTGTIEQVYLALRLAAVDQLDKGGERLPLFLDETLVNWDPERLDRGLELLADVAKTRQLFVFTCHPEAAERLAARGARVIRLEPPARDA